MSVILFDWFVVAKFHKLERLGVVTKRVVKCINKLIKKGHQIYIKIPNIPHLHPDDLRYKLKSAGILNAFSIVYYTEKFLEDPKTFPYVLDMAHFKIVGSGSWFLYWHLFLKNV